MNSVLRGSLLLISCLSVGAAGCSASANADEGRYHEVVIEIAEGYLSDEARDQIDQLLGGGELIDGLMWQVPAELSNHRNAQRAPELRFVTIPAGSTYEEVGYAPLGDAVLAMELLPIDIFYQNRTDAERVLALRLIVRIIADLHLPRNIRFEADDAQFAYLIDQHGDQLTLGEFWNTYAFDADAASAESIIARVDGIVPAEDQSSWARSPIQAWVNEGARIREYLTREYAEQNAEGIEDLQDMGAIRTKQAAIRTAAYLNIIFSAEYIEALDGN